MEFASPPLPLIEGVLLQVFGKEPLAGAARTNATIVMSVANSNDILPAYGVEVGWDKEHNTITAVLTPDNTLFAPVDGVVELIGALNRCLRIFLEDYYPGLGRVEVTLVEKFLIPSYVLDFDCTHAPQYELEEMLGTSLYRGVHSLIFSHEVFQSLCRGGKIPNTYECFTMLWRWWCVWEMQMKKLSGAKPHLIMYPRGLFRSKYTPLISQRH